MDFSHLHDMFFESYNARFPKMVRLWSQLRRTEELTQLKEFKFETHSLKGEAGALGFDELFSIVKNIDDIAHNILADGFNAKSIKDVDSQLNLLIAAGKEDNNPLLEHPNKKSSEDFGEASPPKLIESPLNVSIALVDADKSDQGVRVVDQVYPYN
jgi:chemotaxis protein histidine kinase CheA